MVELKGTSGLLDQFGKPITRAQHANLQHTIGAEIEAPTLILPTGSVSALGSSGIPAREDHVHASTSVYFETKAAMDAVNTMSVGTIATVGTISGTVAGGNAPRVYVWTGSAWTFYSWWGANGQPGVRLVRSNQSINNVTVTDLATWTVTFDPDGWYPGGAATSVTVPTGFEGQWAVSFAGVWAGSPGTNNGCQVVINGSGFAGGASSMGHFSMGVHVVRTLATTNTVRWQVYQSSGAALNVTGRIEIAWIGPGT